MSDTLKAWCHWKRKEVGRTKTMIDKEGEIELVQAIEDVISQVGTWKAKYEKVSEQNAHVLKEYGELLTENTRLKAVVDASRSVSNWSAELTDALNALDDAGKREGL